MWETEELISLPRSKHAFFLSCHKGEILFMKAGKGYYYHQNSWSQVRNYGLLKNKISRVIPSQTKKISLHLPKVTPLLALHENRSTSILLTLPIPFHFLAEDADYQNLADRIDVNRETLCVATTHQRVGDLSYIFSQQPKVASAFSSHINEMAVNDDGRIIAIDFDDQLWVWNQLPEEVRGDGNWINLSMDESFNYQKYERQSHCSPLSFHQLNVFRNPDEGSGVCAFTCLLPPCRPFDMLYLFNSVCLFTYPRQSASYKIKIPILEGCERPSIFWSPCCRILVVAVNNSIIMLTRELQIINTIPLTEVLLGENPIVSDLSWSADSQFFIVTSTTGFLGAVTRDGKSILHCICDILFREDYYHPLRVTADTSDPYLYVIYSDRYMRTLRLDPAVLKPFIGNYLSLPYPLRDEADSLPPTVDSIQKVNIGSPYEVVQLIYYSDLFGVFRYQNPLRYMVFAKLNQACTFLLKNNQDLFVFFLIRCVLYVTSKEPDVYQEVMKRLNFSTNKRDKIMMQFLEEERQRRDWSYAPIEKNVIKMYDATFEDEEQMRRRQKPEPKKDADLVTIIKCVNNIFYNDDFYEVDEIPIDITMLFEIMIQLGRFDKAALLSQHTSIAGHTTQLLIRIATIHANDPVAIFRAMMVCINSSPIDEPELRAICVLALNNILKQQIADTTPTAENPKPRLISNRCVIEETFDIPYPKNREQCNDFAIICGIALTAADYEYVQYFCNGKSMNIPVQLEAAIRELISLIWFVHWRYYAMRESFIFRTVGDATLRLIPFGDFINQQQLKSSIQALNKSRFNSEIYDMYMNGPAIFQNDPDFVDFICEISVRVSRPLVGRMQEIVGNFAEPFEDLPKSPLLTSLICSHVVPWLRCGIPRAMVKFDKACEIVPYELLQFEDFSLLKEKPKPLIIQPKEAFDIPAIVDVPPDSDKDTKAEDEIPVKEAKNPKELPEQVPIPDEDRELSEGEEPPKKKTKTPKRKKEVNIEPSKHKKKKPLLKLIEVDQTPRANKMPIQVPLQPEKPEVQQGYPFCPLYDMDPYMGHPPPVAIFQAVHAPFPQQSYGPIWDLDPALYERPFPKEPPNIPREKSKPSQKTSTKSTQIKPVEIPRNIPVFQISRKNKVDDISDDYDLIDDAIEPDYHPEIDPFPLDQELQKRVDDLLNNPVEVKIPTLPKRPRYTVKIERTEHIIDNEFTESKK